MNSTALTWIGRDRGVDPPGQFFLQAEQAGRAVEVAGAQFAQIGLEQIGDARQRRLDRLDLLLFLDLEHDLDLEILHALAGRADQVDHHVRHFDESRRLRRRRLGVHLLAVMPRKKKNQVAAPPPRMASTPTAAMISLSLPFGAARLRRLPPRLPPVRCLPSPARSVRGSNAMPPGRP